MSDILAVFKVRKPGKGWWLILDCGHWYKWTAINAPPRALRGFDCPSCR